ncbi:Hypothetical protein CM240_2104 [Clostridium bornimense]|uniref:LysM domain-containing protein n=1 Tax=Clostridium bornimense TaxID=1216932 RepID=W6RX61_9CLOT|nr:phage tail tip lysozyme [Clostridium bornimense]CDM69261.1 Hypothetical protein CM240_2104 [Clostridium bornimense]
MSENMNENAKYIYSYFIKKGWTSNSICGMLGNMQVESGIIADIDEISGGGGYGLVQWTPKSKLTSWAKEKSLNYKTVDTQCRRIQWELENNKQYIKTSDYPLTFKAFTQSTKSPTYLAKAFLANYERPANYNQPKRWAYAEKWYDTLAKGLSNNTKSATYTVKSGDTLTSIAKKFDVTIANIQSWNNISNPNLITVGQSLIIKGYTTYTVKSGDTLSAIAKKFNVTVANIQTWNDIRNANVINIGQVLIIKC